MTSSMLGAIAVAVAVLIFCLVLLVGFLAVGLFVLRRRGGPAGLSRDEVLAELGYTHTSGKQWVRKLQGTPITFDEARGLKWTVRLPRYNTLTVLVEERDSGKVPEGRIMETGHPSFDARFVVASALAAQAVALVTNKDVIGALLAVPFVSLELSGDELVLVDPERRCLAGAADAVEAERAAHVAVGNLVVALFGAMYSKETGTILAELR